MTADVNKFAFGAPESVPPNPREMKVKRIGPAGTVEVEVMIYRGELADLRPLVIVGSIDFPMPPAVKFCEHMWSKGLQVIYIRRPGFGGARALPSVLLDEKLINSGATVAAEAALLLNILDDLSLRNIILMGLGTGNSVCYRLSRLSKNVSLSIYANPVFNQDILEVFRPRWFQTLLGLIMKTRSGVRIAEVGLKHQLKKDPVKFYDDVLEKCPGDRDYIAENRSDLFAASELFLNVQPETFFYDIRMTLLPDRTLKDGYFADLNAVVLSGEETTDIWKSELNREAKRLSLPVVLAPKGDIFVPYVSPEYVLSTIAKYDQSAYYT
ncbi:MAG: hypothetical protein JJ931_07680 [Henriciella sp.]|jgi:pimeloyl-ACP methyl ester carboxylesterase|nr:hypothetical protein [Henriciella sp.]MBO6695282.1 hypothetical protein [Henriciella sp.]